MVNKRRLGIHRTVIGDSGVTDHKDILGTFVCIISAIIIVGLIALGFMAYFM